MINPIDPTAKNETVIDMKSRDRAGNLKEHLRIHEDGREEVIFRAPELENK